MFRKKTYQSTYQLLLRLLLLISLLLLSLLISSCLDLLRNELVNETAFAFVLLTPSAITKTVTNVDETLLLSCLLNPQYVH